MCCFYTPVQWVAPRSRWAAGETLCHLSPSLSLSRPPALAAARRALRAPAGQCRVLFLHACPPVGDDAMVTLLLGSRRTSVPSSPRGSSGAPPLHPLQAAFVVPAHNTAGGRADAPKHRNSCFLFFVTADDGSRRDSDDHTTTTTTGMCTGKAAAAMVGSSAAPGGVDRGAAAAGVPELDEVGS